MFEKYDEEYFLNEAKKMGDTLNVDTRDGSIYMDAAAGHAIRTAFFFSNMDELFEMFSIDDAYGVVLDYYAKQDGFERLPATPAEYHVLFSGAMPDPGERFMADEYFFRLEYEEKIPYLICESTELATNALSEGTSAVPVDYIQGLESAVLSGIKKEGTPEEDDDSLRSRWREFKSGPSENGNMSQYKVWCESVPGIGRARIIPLWAGENTVKAVLFSTSGERPADEIVYKVQDYIDPITQNYSVSVDGNTYVHGDGWGEGVAPLGAHFFATAAIEREVSVTGTVILSEGSTVEAINTLVREHIVTYLKELVLNSPNTENMVIRINSISNIIYNMPEVLDYEQILLNGEDANIIVNADCVAILKEVLLSASV